MEINVYAPLDCVVKKIEECQDEAFAEKMMGDGLVVVPKTSTFTCPLDSAIVKMVFNTKHAYGLQVNDCINILIHCGIDTVDLNGVPFKAHVEVDDHVKKGDVLFDVDLNYLKEKNVLNETPIIFENNEHFNLDKLDVKVGEYKKGDLIAIVNFSKKIK